jgi:peptidoglycan-associated lipoprotein
VEEEAKMKSRWMVLTIALCAALVLGTTGCKHRKKNMGSPTGAGSGLGAGDTNGGIGSSGLPGGAGMMNFNPATELEKVYFDYDKCLLRGDAIATLNRNAAKIKASGGAMIQIEGHCDERGTQEYNLALGERRALAVRDYLITAGVPGNQLTTMSYGEERPEDPGHSEASWAKNRRCQFNKAQ